MVRVSAIGHDEGGMAGVLPTSVPPALLRLER
jgi:hypothetical protein